MAKKKAATKRSVKKTTEDSTHWKGRPECAVQLSEELKEPVTPRKIAKWKSELAAPFPRSGKINKADIYRWLLLKKRNRGDKSESPESLDSAELRAKKTELEVELLREKLKQIQETSIDRAEVYASVTAAVEAIKSAFIDDLPSECIEIVLDKNNGIEQSSQLIRDKIESILQLLSDEGGKYQIKNASP